MTVLKLESFSHDVEIRRGISKFESFEALRDSAYSEGVKAGAEATSRAFEDEKIRTLAPILEALNDMGFTQVEACQAMLESMRPMVEQLVETVLPDSARQGLASEVAALLGKAYEKAPTARIVITVNPDAVSSIQSLLAPSKADFTIEPDPALGELQARVNWQGGYDQINLDEALKDVRAAIDTFFTTFERTGTDNA
jgi:flagellar assembly protein FliH